MPYSREDKILPSRQKRQDSELQRLHKRHWPIQKKQANPDSHPQPSTHAKPLTAALKPGYASPVASSSSTARLDGSIPSVGPGPSRR